MRAHLVAIALALSPATAGAVVRVRLQVDPPNPAAGQTFHIIYGISAQNESRTLQATPLDLPGLEILANPSPPSTGSFGMFGGPGMQMTMESNVEYLVVASRPGRYTVRNAAIMDAQSGQVVARAAPLTVVVGPPNPNAPPPPQAPQPGFPGFPGFPGMPGYPQEPVAPTGPDVPPDGALTGAVYDPSGFIRVVVDNPTPFVGQPVVYRAWAYLPAYDAGCEPLQEPTVTGFWSENLLRQMNVCAQRWIPVTVNGGNMGAGMVRHLALFPTRAGDAVIGPLVMNMEFIVGDAFFGSRRRVRLSSPSLTVSVREPPTEGRPRDYVPGTIGPITLEASLDRPRVTAGETATLTLRVRGNGYIGSVTLPTLPAVDGVRALPATSRLIPTPGGDPTQGLREDTVALIPQRAGQFSLGTYSVSYFDPSSMRYERATVALPALEATGPAVQRDDDASHEDPAVALDPFDPGASLAPHRAVFTTGPRIWGAVALPGLALLAGALARMARALRAQRRQEDEDLSRNDPTRLLDAAERAAAKGDLSDALSLLGRAISLARKGHDAPALRDAQTEADTLRFAGAAEGSADSVRGLIARVRPLCRTEDAG